MSAGLPDLVDCARLAADAAVLERVYALADLSRLSAMLAQPVGTLSVRYAFTTLGTGRFGATLTFEAAPMVECQRCLQGFRLELGGSSEVEFASDAAAETMDSERELFTMKGGLVSLCDLAEEELLLSLPIAPACATPLTCGRAPGYVGDADGTVVEMRRPFAALQDLLKKTR